MSETLDTGTPELLCDVDAGVATLTLNRPHKRNALSDTLTPALRAMLPLLDARSDVRCIVLTGAGQAFCAGGDVSQMGGRQQNGHNNDQNNDQDNDQNDPQERSFELQPAS